jgi:hypothetical protein
VTRNARVPADGAPPDRWSVDPELVGRTIVAVECFTEDGAVWREVRLDDGSRITMLAEGPWLIELGALPEPPPRKTRG